MAQTFLALCAVFLSILSSNAQQRTYNVNHLSVNEGLSHTDAIEVKQDKFGFIWIATFDGLDRFDGYRIKKFVNNLDKGNSTFKNRIRSLYPDDNGYIWLLTEDGVQCFNSNTENFISLKQNKTLEATDGYFKIVKVKPQKLVILYQNKIRILKIEGNTLKDTPVKISDSIKIFDFSTDSLGNIWIASDKGILTINSQMVLQKLNVSSDKESSTNTIVSKISFTNKGTMLFVSGNQILETAATSTEILRAKSFMIYVKKRYNVASGQIVDLLLDDHNNCWISTYAGLLKLDSKWNYLQTITNKSQNNGLTSSFLGKLYVDRSECLWVCTYGGGVNFMDLNSKLFYLLQRNPELSNTLSDGFISSIIEEDKDNIWIGMNFNGLCHYNLKSKQFLSITANSGNVRLSTNEIKSLIIDKDNKLWIGVKKGIIILGKSRLALENLPGSDNFPQNSIESLAVDYFGNIWFGSYSNGLGCIVNEKGSYKTKYFNVTKHKQGKSNERINFIYCDPDRPEIFISTINGLERLKIRNDGKVTKYFQYKNNGDTNSLSSNYVWPVQKQGKNIIWVGTLGGGLNKIVLKQNGNYDVVNYNKKQKIFRDVESLQLDDNGIIWMGGKGLQKFDPTSGKLLCYDAKDGLQDNSFKVGASFKGKSGRLYFGGINGLNYFYPSEIKNNPISATPLITDILVNNQSITALDSLGNSEVAKSSISFINGLHLNYKKNNFTILFSSLHYANPEKCMYRYKLDGYDNEWKYTKNPTVTYSNLDYDEYNFILNASNNDGLWSKNEIKLLIDVLPPWWKSSLAKFIYFILFVLFCYGVYLYLSRLNQLKKEFTLHELEEKRREELHIQKEVMQQNQLQFFTNISHEFRTPLTLILGPLEMIIKEDNNPKIAYHLEGMHRNAKRMMNLIAELMNFKKIADNVLSLQVSSVDLNLFIKSLVCEFEEIALQKEIQFATIFESENMECWIDTQVFEKILYNLIDNAFKYSNNGGEISLKVFSNLEEFKPTYDSEFKLLNKHRASKYIYFLIKDYGIGISEESISQVFDRYYRVNNSHIGSGVGLALVKSLVELHKGDIYLYSKKNKGTEIIVAIPASRNNYKPDEINNKKIKNKSVLEKITTIQPYIDNELIENKQVKKRQIPNVLIVEDNDELRLFLKTSLEPFYHILMASNGQIALELIVQKKPDLIISDVMMPVMDGIKLCKVVKETFETSHLPFILLTAKTDLNSQLVAVGYGADYYMSKPFSMDLLLLTIQNIFSQRQKLKGLFAEGYYEDAAKLVQSDVDKKLMQKLMDIIDANLENEELNIEFICNKLNASRSSLYEKVKNISGQSIGDFIRSARLKKALDIMTNEDVNLQDVIERVGLNSISYFSKAFKKEFGKSPTDFLKKLKDK
jgi:signal transduction histidine kinase/ligand-binding sensor domain-containing protein/DNA-binding response OmpR family regulator